MPPTPGSSRSQGTLSPRTSTNQPTSKAAAAPARGLADTLRPPPEPSPPPPATTNDRDSHRAQPACPARRSCPDNGHRLPTHSPTEAMPGTPQSQPLAASPNPSSM